MFKEQKGITLVALVITIIVLLILAGVSISLVVGQNGVLTRSTEAVMKNKAAEVREQLTMALAAAETTYYSAWTSDQSTTRLKAYITDKNVENELKKVLGDSDTVSIPADLVSSTGAQKTVVITKDGVTYTFNVGVNETTGKVDFNATVAVKEPSKDSVDIKL